jgi:hypothetical protein
LEGGEDGVGGVPGGCINDRIGAKGVDACHTFRSRRD